MLGWSFSLGRIFGVELRLHSFCVLLLLLSVAWASALGLSVGRGILIWLLLMLALAIRETARALAAGYFALELRSVLILPTGGIPTYRSTQTQTRAALPGIQKRLALVGPVASLCFGLMIAGIIAAVSPTVPLLEPRWIDPAHLLRTAVWLNLLLAAVNLLPAWPLDAGRVVRGELTRAHTQKEASGEQRKPSLGASAARSSLLNGGAGDSPLLRILTLLGPGIALALIVTGILSTNWWLIVFGLAILLSAQVERQGLLLQTGLDQVLVRDVMLTDFSLLSPSATLEDALEHARHSLQEVFPIVRGSLLVGAIARPTILEALATSGNGYIQGLMTRSFHTSTPGEPLLELLGRITAPASAAAQLVPVLDGDRIVGLVTPQNLQRSMTILARKPQPSAREAKASDDD